MYKRIERRSKSKQIFNTNRTADLFISNAVSNFHSSLMITTKRIPGFVTFEQMNYYVPSKPIFLSLSLRLSVE